MTSAQAGFVQHSDYWKAPFGRLPQSPILLTVSSINLLEDSFAPPILKHYNLS